VKWAGSDDDAGGFEGVAIGLDSVRALDASHSIHRHAVADGKVVDVRVPFEVVRDVVLGRETIGIAREGQAGERAVLRRREELQPIPPLSPRVPHARVGVEDDEVDVLPRQMVARRQSRLPSAYDHELVALGPTRCRHVSPSPMCGVVGEESLAAALNALERKG
jgi:hypothetical protein